MNVRVRKRLGGVRCRSVDEEVVRGGWYAPPRDISIYGQERRHKGFRRIPRIQVISNSKASDIYNYLNDTRVEQLHSGEQELFGKFRRHVEFIFRDSRVGAFSYGEVHLTLSEDGGRVEAWVNYDSNPMEAIEFESIDGNALGRDEEGILDILDSPEYDILKEQLKEKTRLCVSEDIVRFLESDPRVLRLVQDKLSGYGKYESLRRRHAHQRTIAEKFFRRSRGEDVWKLHD